MAYADSARARDRAVSIAAVALIHVGAIYALVTGLKAAGIIEVVTPFSATNIPVEQPTMIPPPQPPAPDSQRSDRTADRPVRQVDTVIDLGITSDPPTVPDTGAGREIGEPFVPPVTEPTQPPAHVPRAAAPRGDPGRWVSENDYPARALREERAGVTGFRLSIGADGRVTGCQVVRSSGSADLDDAACDRVSRRARFDPATDASGARTTGSYVGAVRWTIPR